MEPNRPARRTRSIAAKKRADKATRNDRGELFPSATTTVPNYPCNPGIEAPVLRSAKWVEYIQSVGQEFPEGVCEFRMKLVKYCAKLGFRFDYIKNDSLYVTVMCQERHYTGCKWFIKGAVSMVIESFFIREAELKHSCPMTMYTNDSTRLGQQILGEIITDLMRADSSLATIDMQFDLLHNWGFDVN